MMASLHLGPKSGVAKWAQKRRPKMHCFRIFCAQALEILSSRCEIFRRRRHFCARWHLHVGLRVKTNRAVLRTFGTPEHGHGRAHSVTKSSDVGKEPVARVCTCNHARSCDSARKSTAAWRQVTHAWVGGRRRFVATAFFRRARCLPAAASGFVPKRSRTISAFFLLRSSHGGSRGLLSLLLRFVGHRLLHTKRGGSLCSRALAPSSLRSCQT